MEILYRRFDGSFIVKTGQQTVIVDYDHPLWDQVEAIADEMGPDLKQEPMEDVAH